MWNAAAALAADFMVVVGYGQIIPQSIIDLPRHGILNVHASLLPKYRGAAPIQWAIANGESETGVTIMQIDAGLDTGDMLLKGRMPIRTGGNRARIERAAGAAGRGLLSRRCSEIEAGRRAEYKPQNGSKRRSAPILKKEDGLIDWHQAAWSIDNRCADSRLGRAPTPAFVANASVLHARAARDRRIRRTRCASFG